MTKNISFKIEEGLIIEESNYNYRLKMNNINFVIINKVFFKLVDDNHFFIFVRRDE